MSISRALVIVTTSVLGMLAASDTGAVNATYSFSGGDCTQQTASDATNLATGRDGRGNNASNSDVSVVCPVTGNETEAIDVVSVDIYYDDNNNDSSGGSIVCFWGRQDGNGGLTTSTPLYSCDDAGGCLAVDEEPTHTPRGYLHWDVTMSSATIYSYFMDCDLPNKDGGIPSWITGYEVEQTGR